MCPYNDWKNILPVYWMHNFYYISIAAIIVQKKEKKVEGFCLNWDIDKPSNILLKFFSWPVGPNLLYGP